MNPLSSAFTFDLPMAPQLNDVRQQNSILRSKILKNEQERLQLEQKLRLMMMKTLPNHQRRQIQHIQTYFTRLNHDSQRAEQRNLTLLHELTEAQQRLDQLHNDAENLIELKNDYLAYLERHYPNWQRPMPLPIGQSNEYNRLQQQFRPDHLNNDGNLRQVSAIRQSYDLDSSMLYKRYEDFLKVRFDRTMSPVVARDPMDFKDEAEKSQSESNEIVSNLSRMRRAGSLRMDLTSSGLILLCDYLENEIQYTIDKTQIYSDDNPSLTQKREIINIANRFDRSALKDFGAATISMVILDQLHSTIRRNTVNECFFTDEILSFTFSDLDKDLISKILPEHDQPLWLRLIDHFAALLKLHIMDINTLVEKFALCFLTTNIQDLQVKAKSLLRHVMQKYLSKQSSRIDDEQSISSAIGNRSELFDQSLQ